MRSPLPQPRAILVVDDEPAAPGAMLDALTWRFGGDYRVLPQLSARAALEDLARMKAAGDEIALVIAEQWMPEMTKARHRRNFESPWGRSPDSPRHRSPGTTAVRTSEPHLSSAPVRPMARRSCLPGIGTAALGGVPVVGRIVRVPTRLEPTASSCAYLQRRVLSAWRMLFSLRTVLLLQPAVALHHA